MFWCHKILYNSYTSTVYLVKGKLINLWVKASDPHVRAEKHKQ